MNKNKLMILVASPPASGKTFVSNALCKKLRESGVTPFYIDKDSVIPLSKEVFRAGGAIEDRSSAFFESFVRDAEYAATLNIAEEGLRFSDVAVVCAPFTKELRDSEKSADLRRTYADKNIRLFTVWVYCPKETVKKRMLKRRSERDASKLADIDLYVGSTDYSVPFKENPTDFFVFDNSTRETFSRSLEKLSGLLTDEYAAKWRGDVRRV